MTKKTSLMCSKMITSRPCIMHVIVATCPSWSCFSSMEATSTLLQRME